ncbi:integrase [Microtetraspora glauca]|uniref:Integrase n=1 Tax=Microtetraspora glauca TaxID=1996 RepID=A0ABV3GJ15_MICGL
MSRHFLGSPASITEARRFVTTFLKCWPSLQSAELIVRLATNAVRHSASGRFGGLFTVTASLHDFTCDVNHPGSPSATVVMLRRTGDALDFLVLADSVLVLDVIGADAPMVITDDREGQVGKRYRTAMDALGSGTPDHTAALREYVEAMRAHRNRDGGFWVAASDPLAAEQALTGTLPTDQIRAAALLSDGASRLVDRFGLATWRQALDILAQGGPAELIRQVRQAEHSDIHGKRWPRGKSLDDATAAYSMP